MKTIHEAARAIPIIHEPDICVIGGSATGVFAAVRAARLGRSVVLAEKTNAFGGVATNGLVNIWHSTLDTEFKKRIIGGLTVETMKRLEARDAVTATPNNPGSAFRFNSEELKIELDMLVRENGVVPMLHTSFCAPLMDGDTVKAILIENKDGRSAIRAGMYIDASGDGDLFARCHVPFGVDTHLQSPTACAKIRNFAVAGLNFREMYEAHHEEFGLAKDLGWGCGIPGLPDIQMFAHTHVFGADCSQATQLTHAEIEGRRQIRAVMDMIRKYGPQKNDLALAALPAYIGIRETRRFEAEYCLSEDDVLWGRPFDDAIAQGSYRVDIHHPDDGGFLLKYLNGTTQDYRAGGNHPGRWRDPVDRDPTFYQIPYRTMVNRRLNNAIMAGRMVGADKGAFGAIRVMVNLNQTGEAAGTAAHLALLNGVNAIAVDHGELRRTLREGGSILQ